MRTVFTKAAELIIKIATIAARRQVDDVSHALHVAACFVYRLHDIGTPATPNQLLDKHYQ